MTALKPERVHKIIAQAGVMSRRKAEEAILAGRVTVNGEVHSELGKVVDPLKDQIAVDGEIVHLREVKKTFMFYKPRGVITSKGDPQGRPTVMDFFTDEPALNPIGRLDFESEGLLLLSHDGDLALHLTHPRYQVKKVYEADIEGPIPGHFFKEVVSTVPLEDGVGRFDSIEEIDWTESEETRKIHHAPRRRFVVAVSEGRNRFVRRMFAYYGLEVRRLKRIQMGEFKLGDMKTGERLDVTEFATALPKED